MGKSSRKHTFTEVDGKPKHPAGLNREQYRKFVRPARARRLSVKVLRETQAVVPEPPRGRKRHNILRELSRQGQQMEQSTDAA